MVVVEGGPMFYSLCLCAGPNVLFLVSLLVVAVVVVVVEEGEN